jgi:hypothetical protein
MQPLHDLLLVLLYHLQLSNSFQLLLLQELAATTDSSSTRKFFGLIFPHQDHLLKIYYSIITYIYIYVQITLPIPKNTSNDQSHNLMCSGKLVIIYMQHRACRSYMPLHPNKKTNSRAMHDADHNDPTAKSGRGNLSTTFVLWHIKMPFSAPLVCSRIEWAVSSACIAMQQISAVTQRRRSELAQKFMNPSWTHKP